jgi:hypothetical protein
VSHGGRLSRSMFKPDDHLRAESPKSSDICLVQLELPFARACARARARACARARASAHARARARARSRTCALSNEMQARSSMG